MILNESNFKDENLTGPILFWADWHQESNSAKRELYPDKIKYIFDVDEAPNLPVIFGVDRIPLIGIFIDGELQNLISTDEFKNNTKDKK